MKIYIAEMKGNEPSHTVVAKSGVEAGRIARCYGEVKKMRDITPFCKFSASYMERVLDNSGLSERQKYFVLQTLKIAGVVEK